jgi:hypothetical protein
MLVPDRKSLEGKKRPHEWTYKDRVPHASGANGHRKRQFAERQDSMRATVKRWAGAQDAVTGTSE